MQFQHGRGRDPHKQKHDNTPTHTHGQKYGTFLFCCAKSVTFFLFCNVCLYSCKHPSTHNLSLNQMSHPLAMNHIIACIYCFLYMLKEKILYNTRRANALQSVNPENDCLFSRIQHSLLTYPQMYHRKPARATEQHTATMRLWRCRVLISINRIVSHFLAQMFAGKAKHLMGSCWNYDSF